MLRPVIFWFRRDLRLDDHPGLSAAVASGRPVIALFIHDETSQAMGAAAKWRLGQSLEVLARDLGGLGCPLILRQGAALGVLSSLIAETGAGAVYWTRYYEPAHIARDRAVKSTLRARGIEAESFGGALLVEPRSLLNGTGQPYAVFTPFWRRLRVLDMGAPMPPPARIPVPGPALASDRLDDWQMGGAMGRGAAVVAAYHRPGGAAALARLDGFLEMALAAYPARRDFPDRPATSGLSDHLACGEISPRRIWRSVQAVVAVRPELESAADKFLSELGWREFAWHLMYHHPDMAHKSWRPEWDGFPWRGDNDDAVAWRRGQTGEPIVDAALRELYVTGRIHNRARMIAASYLTKHYLTDWRVGLDWFADCLTDWDPAANALGWQWVSGAGPDAAPYFRVFNPRLQASRFDPDGAYVDRYLGQDRGGVSADSAAFHQAVPISWAISKGAMAPLRISPELGRLRALNAYQVFRARPAKEKVDR